MRPVAAAVALALLAVVLAGCSGDDAGGPDPVRWDPDDAPEHVGHVVIIVLENEDYATTFPAKGPAPSPYLADELTRLGRLLPNFYGVAHASLGNYIALVSGQGPNLATQADCEVFQDFVGAIPPGSTDGQAVGQGCVYPPEVQTVADQLDAAGRTWRLYAEDMANSPGTAPTTCRHPPLNERDPWQGATATDQYATRHVPFVYFHSVIDDQASCDAHLVDLSLLPDDLADADKTPEYVLIIPDLCSDGHDDPCADPAQRGEYEGIDDFLRAWVPRILDAPAYKQDGLLIVTFDEAESGSTAACCAQPTGPNTPSPGITGPGGGQTGTVLLSPCLEPGSIDTTPYNHYSLLRTTQDIFGLQHLGHAAQDGLVPFDLGQCTTEPA